MKSARGPNELGAKGGEGWYRIERPCAYQRGNTSHKQSEIQEERREVIARL